MSSLPPGARVTRQTHRGTARREQILREAAALFLEHGYAGVSVDAIVQKVGGSKTNVYSQFGGKEGVFAAVVQEECRQLLAQFEAMDVIDQPVAQGLRTLGRQLLDVLIQERHIAFQRLVISESGRLPQMALVWFNHGPRQSRQVIARFLAARQALGEIRDGDTALAATLFHDMITFNPNLFAMLGVTPTPAEIDYYLEQAVQTFLHGRGLDPTGSGHPAP